MAVHERSIKRSRSPTHQAWVQDAALKMTHDAKVCSFEVDEGAFLSIAHIVVTSLHALC